MTEEASLREQIRRLSFIAPSLSEALLGGNFRSVFRGRGMDFDTLREYGINDDAMRMDWNATARLGRPYVKTYKDDRDLSMWLVIDESASMNFGSERTKKETAALSASLLLYACSLNEIRVGALFFGKNTEIFPPVLGQNRALLKRLSENGEQLSKIDSCGSNLGKALETLASRIKRRSLVLILSDFLTSSYALPLALLSRKNDVAVIRINDKQDGNLNIPNIVYNAKDSENQKVRMIAPLFGSQKEELKRHQKDERLEWLLAMSTAKVPYIEMDAKSNPVESLVHFFGNAKAK